MAAQKNTGLLLMTESIEKQIASPPRTTLGCSQDRIWVSFQDEKRWCNGEDGQTNSLTNIQGRSAVELPAMTEAGLSYG